MVTAYQTEFDQFREGIFGARSPTLTTNNPFKFFIEETEVQIRHPRDAGVLVVVGEAHRREPGPR